MGYSAENSAYTCDYCYAPIKPDAIGISRRVTGWAENRKQGGANAIRYPETPTGYAHNVCLEAHKRAPQTKPMF
jgi:hypothetical protein